MTFKDNREFIEALKRTGDIVHVQKEVDWDLEAGAISRRACEMWGPAVLFEKMKDYPSGYRILGAVLGTYRRVAIALGLPADTPVKEIYRVCEERWEQSIEPEVVETGPCKENKMLGADVDLYRFPSPMCHDGDGGRYIGTWGFVVCRNLDSDWVNWGMYRYHIHDQRSLAINPAPLSHMGRLLREKYIPANKIMKVAGVIGADPLSSLAASAGYPAGASEAKLAGGLHRKPVELVRCETSDLLVPSHAEIIIEGEILPDRSVPEGPFGEYSGYRSAGSNPKCYCRVTAVTYRDSPIITMTNHGVPADDGHVGGCISTALSVKKNLQQRKLPVVDVFLPPEGAAFLLVISVSKGGPEVVQKIGDAIGKKRAYISKIIVVDDDVDVFDSRQVMHAFAVKCHSTAGIRLKETPEGTGNPFSPLYTLEQTRRLKGAVAVFDATWDPVKPKHEMPVKSSFKSIYPREIIEKVEANWRHYGFK